MVRSTKATSCTAAVILTLGGCAGLDIPDAVRNEQSYPTRPATTFFTAALPCVGRMVEESLPFSLIVVPDVRDGDEPTQGTHPGLGPRRLANDMVVVAIQNMRTAKVLAASDLTAAQKRAERLERTQGAGAAILVVSGGTLVQDDVRGRGVDASGGSGPLSGSLGWNQSFGQFHMSLAVFGEDAISIPGLGVELNAIAESRENQIRLGVSTGSYEFSLGAGSTGTSVTRAQASQLLFQTGLMQVVGRASGVDISACIAHAHAAAEPYLHGLGAGAAQRTVQGEELLVRLGLLPDGEVSAQERVHAVAGFQRERGLPVTGFVDEATFAALAMAASR